MSSREGLHSDQIDRLAVALEESARATSKGTTRFVEPAEGTLRRALSHRHHMIFGRRGSGKTSLLEKARSELVLNRRPNSLVDMEKFKGHSYPDVLISVLIEAFESVRDWLLEGAVAPANKRSFWRRLRSEPQKKPLARGDANEIAVAFGAFTDELKRLLDAQDEATVETLIREARQQDKNVEVNAKAEIRPVGVTAKTAKTESTTSSDEVKEVARRSKIDFLHRRLIVYQPTLKQLIKFADADGFLLLDDLYHIPRANQAEVLDYFHRLLKGTGLWLKVGTIRHRSTWYRHGDPPVGMKLGDDAEEIDLDVTLEKYETAKRFLNRVLQQLAKENEVDVSGWMTPGAKDRLVLVSGGVARDFLSILRRAISIAKEHGDDKIDAESVNEAAGEHESAKRDEFRRDAVEGKDQLQTEFEGLTKFCLEERKVNCFLVEKDLQTISYRNIRELVDLRLLHSIASRVTVRNRRGKLYEAYMIDASQYMGQRKRRGVELLEFWKSDGRNRLRRANLIYAENPK